MMLLLYTPFGIKPRIMLTKSFRLILDSEVVKKLAEAILLTEFDENRSRHEGNDAHERIDSLVSKKPKVLINNL